MKKSIFNILLLSPLFMLTACGQSNNKQNSMQKTTTMENVISKPNNPYYSNTDTTKLNVSDAEWKKVLPPDLYAAVAEVLAWAYEIDGKTVPEPPKT
jgi:hypothetical protein